MIPVQNIYYMLSYAFKVLHEQAYKSVETEQFHNVAELCSAILTKGVSLQIKRGFEREYICKIEELSSPRGKLDISKSIKTQSMRHKKLVCTYDDFSINSYMNRIIKTTMLILLKSKISRFRKKELRKLLVFFVEVDELDVNYVNWNIRYNRNNQNYQMLISVCYLVIKGLLQTQSDGTTKLMDFLDEQRMCHLYEKFILEYYRKEFKYYAHSLQQKYDRYSIHSGNLYQIFTYVKNKEANISEQGHKQVSGMLLYAKTDEEVFPENEYRMSGNRIEVRTLDLSGDFNSIRLQLNHIANKYLDIGI